MYTILNDVTCPPAGTHAISSVKFCKDLQSCTVAKWFDKKKHQKTCLDVDHITSTRIIRNQSSRSLVPHKCMSNSSLPKSSTSRKRHVHSHKSSCSRTSRETDEQCFWCGDDFTTMFMTTLNILSAARMVKDIFWLRWRYTRWWTFMSIDGHEFKKFQSINWCMYCMYNTMDSSKMSWTDFKDLMIFVLSSNFSSPWKPQKSYHTAPPLLGRGGHRRPCRSGRRWMRNPGAAGWGSAHRFCTCSKAHHTMVFLQRLIKKWSEQTHPQKKIRTCRCFSCRFE